MNKSINKPALGVIFHPTFPPETLADYARRAEAAGFDELWLWDDCFLPGAFTSAAIALAATECIKVGIGLLPAKAYNPLFAVMEITTLERAFPGRILPGFGHGLGVWMQQIGASSKSSLRALRETVSAARRLLNGEEVSMHSDEIHLDQVQMQLTAAAVPPLYVGGMRERTLQLAGEVGDGTILTGMSSPAYVRWALTHIRAGMAKAARKEHRVVVYLNVKVNPDGAAARRAAKQSLAKHMPWADVHTKPMGITEEVAAFARKLEEGGDAQDMPDAWLDAFAAAGTPEQVAHALQQWADAGADSIIFEPLNMDPKCLDEYITYLMPLLIKERL